MMHRFLSLLLLLIFLSPAALAESSFFEEVSSILHDFCASELLPPETVRRLNEAAERYAGKAQAIGPAENLYTYDCTLDVLETVYGVYQSWPISLKHDFDCLMVDLGQLSACLNLLPDADELTRQEAEQLTFAEIEKRFGVEVGDKHTQVNAFYQRVHQGEAPSWRFAVDTEDRAFDVTVQGGWVNSCREIRLPAELEQEYETLCEERGAFFKWTVEQKAAYADGLWERLEQESDFPGADELITIANYGFCLPTVSCITQDECKEKAVLVVEQTCFLPDGWEAHTEPFYSFFVGEQVRYVWRVIFWPTDAEGFSAVVEINAETGEVLQVRENGGTMETAIPYEERM